MKASLVAALATVVPSLGFGATIIQVQNFSFVPNGSQTQTFDKFDTSLGTLESITVSVVLNKTGGRFEVDNDSEESGTVDITHSVVGSISASPGTALLRGDFTQIGSNGTLNASNNLNGQAVAATTGDDINSFNATGAGDYIIFQPGNSSGSDSGEIGSLFFGGYEGTGTFTTTVNANQISSATGLGGLQQAFTVSNVSGTVTVTYNYTAAVPEASSSLLGAIGTLLLVRRRRDRR